MATMDSENEKALIEKANVGDLQAKATLLRNYERLMKHILNNRGPRRDRSIDLEDDWQELFLRLAPRKRTFDPEGSVKSYLAKCATNQKLNAIRDENRFKRTFQRRSNSTNQEAPSLELVECRELQPVESLVTRESIAAVKMAFERLNPAERQLIKFIFFEGKSNVEIARDLGIAPGTVASRLSRTLLKLRSILKGSESDLKASVDSTTSGQRTESHVGPSEALTTTHHKPASDVAKKNRRSSRRNARFNNSDRSSRKDRG